MFIIAFVSFLISLIAVVLLLKIKFNNFLRGPLIFFFAAILLVSLVVGVIGIEGLRIERGGRFFIEKAIADFRTGKMPPLGQSVEPNAAQEIKKVASTIPQKGDCKIEFYDNVGTLVYKIEFESGPKYLCYIGDSKYNGFVAPFTKVEYRLFLLQKADNRK